MTEPDPIMEERLIRKVARRRHLFWFAIALGVFIGFRLSPVISHWLLR
jgi:hypothetical protein